MTQLFVHAHDEATGEFVPVYKIYVMSDGTAVARAICDGWERKAQGVEEALNCFCDTKPQPAAQAAAVAMAMPVPSVR